MCTCSCTVRKKQIPFSMSIGHVELMHGCFHTLADGNSNNEIRQRTDQKGKK